MKCEDFREIVYDLAAKLLDEETAAKAQSHMEDCPLCRKEYEECLEIVKAMAELGEEEAPAELLPNVMGRIAKEKSNRRLRIIQFAASAAAALFLVAGSVAVMPRLKHNVDSDKGEQETVTENAEEADDTDEAVMPRAASFDVAAPDSSAAAEAAVQTDAVQLPESGDSVKTAVPETEYSSALGRNAGNAEQKAEFKKSEETVSGSTDGIGEALPQMSSGYFVAGIAEDDGGRLVEEIGEKTYIARTSEFFISAEFAESAANVTAKGKTMEQLAEEFDSLGVLYEIYIVEDDFTEEYETASEQRRIEIEALCENERCLVTVE